METLRNEPLVKVELRCGVHGKSSLSEIGECRERAKNLFGKGTNNIYFIESTNGTPPLLELIREVYNSKGSYLAAAFTTFNYEDLSKEAAEIRLSQLSRQYLMQPNVPQAAIISLSCLWQFKSLDDLANDGLIFSLEIETPTLEEIEQFGLKRIAEETKMQNERRLKALNDSQECANRGDTVGVLSQIDHFLRLTTALHRQRGYRDVAKISKYAELSIANQQPTRLFLSRGLLHRRSLTFHITSLLTSYGNLVDVQTSSSNEKDEPWETPIYKLTQNPDYHLSRHELLEAAFFPWVADILSKSNRTPQQSMETIDKTLRLTKPEEIEQLIARMPKKGFSLAISQFLASKLW